MTELKKQLCEFLNMIPNLPKYTITPVVTEVTTEGESIYYWTSKTFGKTKPAGFGYRIEFERKVTLNSFFFELAEESFIVDETSSYLLIRQFMHEFQNANGVVAHLEDLYSVQRTELPITFDKSAIYGDFNNPITDNITYDLTSPKKIVQWAIHKSNTVPTFTDANIKIIAPITEYQPDVYNLLEFIYLGYDETLEKHVIIIQNTII